MRYVRLIVICLRAVCFGLNCLGNLAISKFALALYVMSFVRDVDCTVRDVD